MRSTPYWLDTSVAGPDRTTTQVDSRVDVAVVGAGLTGLCAALHLARAGVRVAVLEADRVASGASGRNGGMAAPGLTIGLAAGIERYGVERATRWHLLYDEAISAVEQLVTEEGIDCDFSRVGKLTLAAKPSHVAGLRTTHEQLRDLLHHDTTLLTRDQLSAEIGSAAYHGGLVDPRGAALHSGAFTRGLAEAAAGHGARLHEGAPVTDVRRVTGHRDHELVTPRGRVRAEQVLVATSGYTRRPFRWLQLRIVPVGSFIIVTEPLGPEVCDALLPRRRTASDTKNLLHYFRITPDQRLLFGGRARFAASDPQSDARSGRILREAMIQVFPQLREARVDYCWGGMVDMTLDRLPHAGVHDGLHYCLGYSGHGVQMATLMGRRMAQVLTGDPAANPWQDRPLRWIPGHVGPPWFLPFAGAYYKTKDRLR